MMDPPKETFFQYYYYNNHKDIYGNSKNITLEDMNLSSGVCHGVMAWAQEPVGYIMLPLCYLLLKQIGRRGKTGRVASFPSLLFTIWTHTSQRV